MIVFLRRVWTVSVAAARTPTWPMERRSWRPLLCQRKLWSRRGSHWASISPVSRRHSEARPPAPLATRSSMSPLQRGPPSPPPSCPGQDTTTGALKIHWRCGLTAEVLPFLQSVSAHSPPAHPAGRARDLRGRSQNKAATVTGVSRPKLHRACGLAYRCSEEETGGDVALLCAPRLISVLFSSRRWVTCRICCVATRGVLTAVAHLCECGCVCVHEFM